MCAEMKSFMKDVSQQEPYVGLTQQWIRGTEIEYKASKNLT